MGWIDLERQLRHRRARTAQRQRLGFDRRTGARVGERPDGSDVLAVWSYDTTGGWVELDDGLVATPGRRSSPALSFDEARQRVVLFGGESNGRLGDTWEWSEASGWVEVLAAGGAGAPDPRASARMVYDPILRASLLTGGSVASPRGPTNPRELLAWDGTAWTRVSTTGPTPEGREGFAMVYDPVRAVTVFFAGRTDAFSSLVQLDDTWHFDSATGTFEEQLRGAPIERRGSGLVFVPSGGFAALVGGSATGSLLDPQLRYDWTYDLASNRWRRLGPASFGSGQEAARAFFDQTSGRAAVVSEGLTTWRFDADALTWSEEESAAVSPEPDAACAFDTIRGRSVCHLSSAPGGTWESDGSSWSEVATSADSPTGHEEERLVFDAARATSWLYANGALHGWNGITWTDVDSEIPGPDPRESPAMAYDPIREVVWLYAGRNSDGPLSDVWKWNGAMWDEEDVTAGGPGGRHSAAMGISPDGRIFVFGGGRGGTIRIGDLWEYVPTGPTPTGDGGPGDAATGLDAGMGPGSGDGGCGCRTAMTHTPSAPTLVGTFGLLLALRRRRGRSSSPGDRVSRGKLVRADP
ncbi:MAG: MYXO-CTERM domain-containing protein [Polyangiales bacterium]|jgi:MYXO-CTERM domain-containing protein